MKRLNELTKNEKAAALVAGTKVAYEDMANPYTEYTIENIYTTRWGTDAVLTSKDGETVHLAINAGFQQGWTLVQ